jgi:hypothetical protein
MKRRLRLKIIHGLDYAMRITQATDEMLSVRAGVSHTTVSKARSGQPVLFNVAEWITEALKVSSFSYGKRGPKYIRALKSEWN